MREFFQDVDSVRCQSSASKKPALDGSTTLGSHAKTALHFFENILASLEHHTCEVALNTALSAHREGRITFAIEEYRQVLRWFPENPQALHFLGVALAQASEFDEAASVLKRAVAITPNDAQIRVHLGNAFLGLRQSKDALSSYEEALTLDPRCLGAHVNRGKVLNNLDFPELAIECFDRALAIEPFSADTYNCRGSAMAAVGRNSEAVDNYNRALEIDPLLSEARWNKSLVLLRQGDFAGGWKCHTASPQYQSPNSLARFPSLSAWTGIDDPKAKTFLLHADQGYGDVIQYCRYALLLQQMGARVLLEVPKPLQGLLSSLEGVDALITRGDALPPFQMHCPFSNLPGAFRTDLKSIPGKVPYLRCDGRAVKRWATRLGERRTFRVGLVWSGNPSHKQDGKRSIPLSELRCLRSARAEFVSLQKEVRDADAGSLSSVCNWHFGKELADFSDTAGVISQLDLVISVDTAVAHLAGALGVRTWILLPFVPDWRWMLGRHDSPWYPSVRLYRQTTRGEWEAPIAAVLRDLTQLALTVS